MSSSSSSRGTIAARTYYPHPSCYTGAEKGSAEVFVRRVDSGGMFAHHYIVVDVPEKERFVVYEWTKTGVTKFATMKIRGKCCKHLGEFTLDEVSW